MKKRGNYSFIIGGCSCFFIFLVSIILLTCSPCTAGNGALESDGVDDYGIVSASSDWNFATGDFTIESWFKINYFDGMNQRNLVNLGDVYSDSGAFRFSVSYTGFYINFAYNKGEVNDTIDFWAEGVSINPGTWYHTAAVRMGSVITVFFNGNELASLSNVTQSIGRSDTPLTIGRSTYAANTTSYMAGQIDELRFWDDARTEQELQFWKDYELTSSEEDLLAYWNFNEGTGQVCYDVSGNGHNIQLGSLIISDNNDPNWIVSSSPVTPIPEPATFLLFGMGGLLAALFHKSHHLHSSQNLI